MSDIKQKLNDANSTFARSLKALQHARQAYETDAGQTLAETATNCATLRTRIGEQTQAAEDARNALKTALRVSNAAVTPESKAALAARRNADDLLDQYSEMLVEADFQLVEATISANDAAAKYEHVYREAKTAQVAAIAYTALDQCGEVIARAIAAGGREIIAEELNWLVEKFESADGQEESNQLAPPDLGALASSDRLSSAVKWQIRQVMQGKIDASNLPVTPALGTFTEGLTHALATVRERMSSVIRA
jgi:predicted 3-demethylubiquinone-9 3-methyltransferase (glyoxalase superfamily)